MGKYIGMEEIATSTAPASIMVRSTGKRRALSVLEKCEIRLEPEHAKEKLSDFGKHFLDRQVGNHKPLNIISSVC